MSRLLQQTLQAYSGPFVLMGHKTFLSSFWGYLLDYLFWKRVMLNISYWKYIPVHWNTISLATNNVMWSYAEIDTKFHTENTFLFIAIQFHWQQIMSSDPVLKLQLLHTKFQHQVNVYGLLSFRTSKNKTGLLLQWSKAKPWKMKGRIEMTNLTCVDLIDLIVKLDVDLRLGMPNVRWLHVYVHGLCYNTCSCDIIMRQWKLCMFANWTILNQISARSKKIDQRYLARFWLDSRR
jgi:hypothetical protein